MISTEFPHDLPLHSPHATIHFKSCFRHEHKFARHFGFVRQFWLVSTPYTAWKVSVFGVILVRIFKHSEWIPRVSLRIQSECGKIWTRITPNTDTFYIVLPTYVHPHSLGFKQCKLRYFYLQTWRWNRNDSEYIARSVGGKVSGFRTAHVVTACINLAYCKLGIVSPFLPSKLKEHFWYFNLFAFKCNI